MVAARVVGRNRPLPGRPGWVIVDPVEPPALATTTRTASADQGASAIARTAVHEAAHAVVAVVLGIPIDSAAVSVHSNVGVSGEVRTGLGGYSSLVRVMLAGAVAERAYGGDVDSVTRNARSDFENAAAFAANGTWVGKIEDEMAATRDLVVMHRSSITALAGEIARRRFMTGDEIRAFLRGRIVHASTTRTSTSPCPDCFPSVRSGRLCSKHERGLRSSRTTRLGGRSRRYETATMDFAAIGPSRLAVDLDALLPAGSLLERGVLLALAARRGLSGTEVAS